MDNTFFSGLSTSITGVVGLALTAVVILAALILGSTVGYRLYKNFTYSGPFKSREWENYYNENKYAIDREMNK